MKSTVISQTGAGTTAWIVVDTWKESFHVAVACVVTGTVDYDVEHTYDDVLRGVTATAWTNADMDGKTANAAASYNYPIKAIRLKVNSGSGTVAMTVLQSG